MLAGPASGQGHTGWSAGLPVGSDKTARSGDRYAKQTKSIRSGSGCTSVTVRRCKFVLYALEILRAAAPSGAKPRGNEEPRSRKTHLLDHFDGQALFDAQCSTCPGRAEHDVRCTRSATLSSTGQSRPKSYDTLQGFDVRFPPGETGFQNTDRAPSSDTRTVGAVSS